MNLKMFYNAQRKADERMVAGIAMSYQIDPTKAMEYLDEEQIGALIRVASRPSRTVGSIWHIVIVALSNLVVVLALLAVIRWLWPYATGDM